MILVLFFPFYVGFCYVDFFYMDFFYVDFIYIDLIYVDFYVDFNSRHVFGSYTRSDLNISKDPGLPTK